MRGRKDISVVDASISDCFIARDNLQNKQYGGEIERSMSVFMDFGMKEIASVRATQISRQRQKSQSLATKIASVR